MLELLVIGSAPYEKSSTCRSDSPLHSSFDNGKHCERQVTSYNINFKVHVACFFLSLEIINHWETFLMKVPLKKATAEPSSSTGMLACQCFCHKLVLLSRHY